VCPQKDATNYPLGPHSYFSALELAPWDWNTCPSVGYDIILYLFAPLISAEPHSRLSCFLLQSCVCLTCFSPSVLLEAALQSLPHRKQVRILHSSLVPPPPSSRKKVYQRDALDHFSVTSFSGSLTSSLDNIFRFFLSILYLPIFGSRFYVFSENINVSDFYLISIMSASPNYPIHSFIFFFWVGGNSSFFPMYSSSPGFSTNSFMPSLSYPCY